MCGVVIVVMDTPGNSIIHRKTFKVHTALQFCIFLAEFNRLYKNIHVGGNRFIFRDFLDLMIEKGRRCEPVAL